MEVKDKKIVAEWMGYTIKTRPPLHKYYNIDWIYFSEESFIPLEDWNPDQDGYYLSEILLNFSGEEIIAFINHKLFMNEWMTKTFSSVIEKLGDSEEAGLKTRTTLAFIFMIIATKYPERVVRVVFDIIKKK